MSEETKKQLTYADAGVNIDAGNEAVELMKASVQATYRPEVIGDIGGFGGLFALNSGKYKEPVLVSGTDGVGTKLKLAFMADAQIVKGVANACKESGCALIGGETAEMSDLYGKDEYDIAGFCVGVVEKSKMITGEKVKPGDVLLGLPSAGVHSNGFTLVRKICFDVMGFTMDTPVEEFGTTLGEELLKPTRLYPRVCLPLIEKFNLHGMVHITGGGFYDNIPRILPENCDADVNAGAWEVPVVFKKLQEWGNVDWHEMYRTFNMGVGMVLVVAPEEADAVREHLKNAGETFYELGTIIEGSGKAVLKGGVFGE